jgi:hypothetical protein
MKSIKFTISIKTFNQMKKFFLIITLVLPSIGAFANNNSAQANTPKNVEQEATYRVILTSCGTRYTAPAGLSDQAADLCIEYDHLDCDKK